MAAVPADDIFKYIFMNEKACISIGFSLKFVPKVPIVNNAALVQIMALRQTGARSLSGPMMVHIGYSYMRHSASMSYMISAYCVSSEHR